MSGAIGVWFVGARGSVASTAVVGALAIRAGLADSAGCVTELAPFADAGLPGIEELVFGGHDVVDVPLAKRAELLAAAGVVPAHLPTALAAELAGVDAELRQGIRAGESGGTQREAVERLVADLTGFRERHGLRTVVVVDCSSTEPPARYDGDLAALEAALDAGEAPLPPSSCYAYAAFRAGCPLAAFTPSPGPRLPALVELAERDGVPWAGSDGKTGETLLKTALAPMFAQRALRVLSWSGTNLLGGGDGATLGDRANVTSKIDSKVRGLEAILGYQPSGPLHIDNVPDLGEWKTAWDHVHFAGFLGTRMTLQFTWAGCDSALAAPLVLDLARLLARAADTGRGGPVGELGFFFKDPAGSTEHRLSAQFDALVSWARAL
ncbi:MAG TPA: inositol-3-phosphate synthase [Pseudonocardiaceae bacterium]